MLKCIFYPVVTLAVSACAFAQVPAAPPAEAPKAAAAPLLLEAFTKAKEASDKGDFATALKILTAEAEKGNLDAVSAVAEFILRGVGRRLRWRRG